MTAISNTGVVGIIGAGAMGAGIAQVAASAGHDVFIFDMSTEASQAAIDNISEKISRLVQKNILNQEDAFNTKKRLHVAKSLEEMKHAHLIVEAIVENLDVKQKLFADLESIVGDYTILTSNTSSLSITAIGSALKCPERFAGFHFFNPAPRMPLVEIVSGLATSKEVATLLYETAVAWGKSPVHAKTTPGFIVNRVARPYYAEALRVLEEGVAEHAEIDLILKECGKFKMGPFELMDMIGHDVNYAVTKSVFDAYYQDPRFRPSLVQQELVSAGWLGQKTGKGFYDYTPLKQEEPIFDHQKCEPPLSVMIEGTLGPANIFIPLIQSSGTNVSHSSGTGVMRIGEVIIALTNGLSASERLAKEGYKSLVLFDLCDDFLNTQRIVLTAAGENKERSLDIAAGLFQSLKKKVSVINDTPGMIVFRTLAMLTNEACEALLNGVANSSDLDTAMKLGVNYPKGPLEWADQIGTSFLHTGLTNIFDCYKDMRYRPSILFSNRVFNNETLSQSESCAKRGYND